MVGNKNKIEKKNLKKYINNKKIRGFAYGNCVKKERRILSRLIILISGERERIHLITGM